MQRECKTRSKKIQKQKTFSVRSELGKSHWLLLASLGPVWTFPAKVPTWQDRCEKRRSHLDSDFLVSSLFCRRNLIAVTPLTFLDPTHRLRKKTLPCHEKWSSTHSAVWYNIKSRLKMWERQKGCKQAIGRDPPRHLLLRFSKPGNPKLLSSVLLERLP